MKVYQRIRKHISDCQCRNYTPTYVAITTNEYDQLMKEIIKLLGRSYETEDDIVPPGRFDLLMNRSTVVPQKDFVVMWGVDIFCDYELEASSLGPA